MIVDINGKPFEPPEKRPQKRRKSAWLIRRPAQTAQTAQTAGEPRYVPHALFSESTDGDRTRIFGSDDEPAEIPGPRALEGVATFSPVCGGRV